MRINNRNRNIGGKDALVLRVERTRQTTTHHHLSYFGFIRSIRPLDAVTVLILSFPESKRKTGLERVGRMSKLNG